MYDQSQLIEDLLALGASQMGLVVKNPLPVQETPVQSLGWEDHLEEGTATHSSILAFVHGESHGQRSLVDYNP